MYNEVIKSYFFIICSKKMRKLISMCKYFKRFSKKGKFEALGTICLVLFIGYITVTISELYLHRLFIAIMIGVISMYFSVPIEKYYRIFNSGVLSLVTILTTKYFSYIFHIFGIVGIVIIAIGIVLVVKILNKFRMNRK